jgi:endonuclease VIII
MPEGPSIVILKEAVEIFNNKKILAASGNAKINMQELVNQPVNFKSWGKHFLICLPDRTIRIHFLMFGSYSINEQTKPDRSLRLCLQFKNGAVYFYTCAIRLLEDKPDHIYDWSADVMNDTWNAAKARKKLKAQPDMMACDALLDQQIFSGVGNIIKNEVLYRIKLHPESLLGKIPSAKLSLLIKEARIYSFEFLEWKKAFELKKHWLAHTKKICTRCNLPLQKKYCGKTKRRSFFCTNCQVLYS